MDFLVIIFAVVAIVLLVLILRKNNSEQSMLPVIDVDELVKLRSQLGAKDEEIKYLKTKIEDKHNFCTSYSGHPTTILDAPTSPSHRTRGKIMS